MKRWMRNIIIGGMIVSLALTACGGEKKDKELPADTPWNNGHYAIMETESGYYSNLVGQQHLRYYEKETGTEIFLCAKPECQHGGGETCTATYHNMKVVNSVLYDGMIYILAIENQNHVVSYNLYKAATDGSALDKVGEVFSAANTSGEDIYLAPGFYPNTEEPAAFIIHKGIAYVPFFMAFPWSAKGFVNGGIMKMNLQTGQTEQIFQMDKLTGLYPMKLWGCGDYVYYNLNSPNGSGSKHAGTHRYNIQDGSVEYVYSVLYPDEKAHAYQVDWVTEEGVFYNFAWDGERKGIRSFERKDGELLSKPLFLLEEDEGVSGTLVLYEDKFFVYGENAASLYDMDGKRLGRITFDFPGIEEEIIYYGYYGNDTELALNISGGKLYASCKNPYYDPYGFQSNASSDICYIVFACSIEELAGGNGKWEQVYSARNLHPEHLKNGREMRDY